MKRILQCYRCKILLTCLNIWLITLFCRECGLCRDYTLFKGYISNFKVYLLTFETLAPEYWERLFFQLLNHTAVLCFNNVKSSRLGCLGMWVYPDKCCADLF